MAYSKLFSEGYIGKLVSKNHIVMTAMETELADHGDFAGDRIIRYFEERAAGGAGIIISELVRVDDQYGAAIPHQLSATSEDKIPSLTKLSEAVQNQGAKLIYQLHHCGRQGQTANQKSGELFAPSPLPTLFGEPVRAMTTEECYSTIENFINAAKIVQKAKADGVEVHAAHGYLLSSFLSPYSNQREDEFGGSLENRGRMVVEIVKGIKEACGEDFPVVVRLNGNDYCEGGLTEEESPALAAMFQEAGADAISVSNGCYHAYHQTIEPISYPQGWKTDMIKAVKAAVTVPVIAVNSVKKPDFAEQMLEEGISDFVGMARNFLADPEWAKKAQEGREDEIRPCISCLFCVECLLGGQKLACAVNPRMGREVDFDQLTVDGNGRTVAVIGGGPGGMNAAITLAQRGFKPVLFEKKEVLGGSVYPGSKPPLKDKLVWFMDHMGSELNRLGVEVRLGTEATKEAIDGLEPYAVFYAAGAEPIMPPIPGVKEFGAVNVMDILEEKVKPEGKNIVVVGSGMTGIETAEFLGERNNKVTVIEMADTIAPGALFVNSMDVQMRLAQMEVPLMPKTMLMEIKENEVVVKNTETEEVSSIPCDLAVLSLGVKPNQKLFNDLGDSVDRLEIIGDAAQAGRIANAMKDGFEKAYALK